MGGSTLKRYRVVIIVGVLLTGWLLFGRDIITTVLEDDPTPAGDIVNGLPDGLSGHLLYTQGRDGIWQIDLMSGESRQWWAGADGSYVRSIALSPDESQVAIAYEPRVPDASPESSTDLYLSPIASPDPVALLEREDIIERYDSPIFSPDGDWLYYAHYRPITANDDPNSSNFLQTVERIRPDEGTIETVLADAVELWIAPDSTQALYTRFSTTTFETSIWLMDIQSGDAQVVIPEGTFLNLGSPRLTNDGQQVFFSASGERLDDEPEAGIPRVRAHGAPWDVWAVTLATGELIRITALGLDGPHLEWIPDQTHLVMLALEGLYLLDMNTGTTYRIAESRAEGDVVWFAGD